MSWVSDYKYCWHEKLALNVMKSGGCVPQHIAFVMDGNRRYARSEQLEKIEGHSRGFEKLADCLRWCLDIGVKEVTTFAFSIENFKRSTEEVEGLLNLAREKFAKIIHETKTLEEHGVCIRVVGNLELLPKDLQEVIAKAMLKTAHNNKLFLNVAFSYTSRDEITQAVEVVLKEGDELDAANISERLLEECLYTRHSAPPNLIFRTSGETRLSDFMMWQLTNSVLYFAEVLWPRLTIWNFLAGIFTYQRANLFMKNYQLDESHRRVQVAKCSGFYTERVQRFLQKLDLHRRNILLQLYSN